jgi:hypothetical protein
MTQVKDMYCVKECLLVILGSKPTYGDHVKQNFELCEVLTVVTMKSFVFWKITQFSLVKVSQPLRGTYHIHLQSQSLDQARNNREKVANRGLLAWVTPQP